jgi:hypothetical protein
VDDRDHGRVRAAGGGAVPQAGTGLTRHVVGSRRVNKVGAWREAPYYTDAERAALALTEAVTRLAESSDPVPDEVWDEAARHYSEKELGGLVLAIASINTWNRINVATRQVTGEWVEQWISHPEPAGHAA